MELRQAAPALALSLRHPTILATLYDNESILCIPRIYAFKYDIDPQSLKDPFLFAHILRPATAANNESTRKLGKSLSVSSFKTAAEANQIQLQSSAGHTKLGAMVNTVLRRANSGGLFSSDSAGSPAPLRLSSSQMWLTTNENRDGDRSSFMSNQIAFDTPSSSINEAFITLSQKSVELDRTSGVLRTKEGFDWPVQSRVIYTEYWSDAKGKFLTVICIEEPLDGEFASNLCEGIQFDSYYILSGLLQGEKIHGFQNLFNRLPEYCRNLESDIANVSADGATAVALLESVRRQSGDLLAAVMKHPLILRLMRQYRDQCTPEYLLRLIENELISHCYENILDRISLATRESEEKLENIIRSLRFVDFIQLGLEQLAGRNLVKAVPIFQQVSSFKNASGKIDCLLKAIKLLTAPIERSVEGAVLIFGSDQLVPMMLLMVIRGNVHQLIAQLKFIELFSFRQDLHLGELGFMLSSFEAVLSYILSAEPSILDLVKASERNRKLWESISNNAVDDINILLEEYSTDCSTSLTVPSSPPALPPKSPIAPLPSSRNLLESSMTETGDNCLLMAVRSGSVETAILLMDSSLFSIIDSINTFGQTALHLAVEGKFPRLVKELLDRCGHCKGFIDHADHEDQTALHLACSHANADIITRILSADAAVDFRDQMGNIPAFIYARVYKSLINRDILLKLLAPLVNEIIPNNSGETIFHVIKDRSLANDVAQFIGASNTVTSLLAADKPHGCSALHKASISGSLGIIEFIMNDLIAIAPSIELDQFLLAVDAFGDTCLHVSAKAGSHDSLKLLLKNSIVRQAIDWKNGRDETALHLAAISNRVDLVRSLLEAGANPELRTSDGRLAVDLCSGSVQELLDNYSLGRSRRTIAVVRAILDQNQTMSFVIRRRQSLEPVFDPQFQTVFRSLQDFFWLRRQLLLQFNDAIVPNFNPELESIPFRNDRPLYHLIARQVKHLDRFLGDLIQHSRISQDSTFIDFLSAKNLDKALITITKKQESDMQRLQELEPFRRPLNVDIQETIASFRTLRNHITALDSHVCTIAKAARSSAQGRLTLALKMRQFPSLLASAKYEIQFAVFILPAAMLESQVEQPWLAFCEDFEAMLPRFQGCQSALRFFEQIRAEYQQSLKLVDRITDTIGRLEFQVAKISQIDEDVVMKLSEQYYELKQAELLVEQKTSLLNYSAASLKGEISEFQELISRCLMQALSSYSVSTLNSERNLLTSLKALVRVNRRID